MPKENGYGYSKHTELKQRHFRSFMSMHLQIVNSVLKRNNWAAPYYAYIDINAGPGRYNGNVGSPVIFLELAKKQGIDYRALFIEIEPQWYKQLKANVKEFRLTSNVSGVDDKVSIQCGDHLKMLPSIMTNSKRVKPYYGILYSDPSGVLPPFDMLAQISKCPCYKALDFLIYCSATTIKRIANCRQCEYEAHLTDELSKISKRYWVVRKPAGKHQWTFLVGTNWEGFPAYQKAGFYKVGTKEGDEILRKITFTKEELENGKQLELPSVQ